MGLVRLAGEWTRDPSFGNPWCDVMGCVSGRSNSHFVVTKDDGFIVKLITMGSPYPPEQLS